MSSRYYSLDSITTANIALDYHEELLASLSRINTYNPPVQTCSTGWSFAGFYSGPTSVAYLFYRLSELYPDLTFKSQLLLEWAEAYLQLSQHVKKAPPEPSHCGIANETLASTALSAVINDDASLVKQLCQYSNIINVPNDDGSNEWLYGRAGYLYFLRLCQVHFGKKDHHVATLISTTISNTIKRIMEVPQPWKWHGKEYLGASHGKIGIIAQIVLSDPKVAIQLSSMMLPELLKTQFDSGNFPSSALASHDDLIQFCHGGPGFVLALKSVSGSLVGDMQEHVNRAVQLAQEDIKSRGLLTKDPCLCHGIAGNFLALDGESQINTFLTQMSSRMLEANKQWMTKAGRDDSFVGLFTGEAGRAWVWAIAEKGLEKTCIGFNDL